MGGGKNHRMGLYDKVLIKENHIIIARGIRNALSQIKGEIEVKNLKEVKEAIENGAKHLLLDNMPIKEVKRAVTLTKGNNIILEYSGNVTLENVKEISRTGVDYISVGALTHSYKSIDISLLLR
jgi:nicotinate-nucleotide pyrophosphorylase (carboxylating)